MAASTPSSFISDLTGESLLSTSPRYLSLQSNGRLQKCRLKPLLGQEYLRQGEMYEQNSEPATESITDTAEWRINVSPSLANVLGLTPTYCHQGTPTENENIQLRVKFPDLWRTFFSWLVAIKIKLNLYSSQVDYPAGTYALHVVTAGSRLTKN